MVGNDRERILTEAGRILRGEIPQGRVPEQCDGHAAGADYGHFAGSGRIRLLNARPTFKISPLTSCP